VSRSIVDFAGSAHAAAVLAAVKGMNLKFVYQRYTYYSQEASKLIRQLGFAGIAVIWIFKTEQNSKQIIPPELLPAGILIMSGLAADLLQYIAGTIVWGIFHNRKDCEVASEEERFDAPRWINWPALVLWVLKVVAILTAYVLIITFLMSRLAT